MIKILLAAPFWALAIWLPTLKVHAGLIFEDRWDSASSYDLNSGLSSKSGRQSGEQAPIRMINNIPKAEWRTQINNGKSQGLSLIPGQNQNNKVRFENVVLASYNFDWFKAINSRQALVFTYIIGKSSKDAGLVFKFGATDASRKNLDGDSKFTVYSGSSYYKFEIGDNTVASGNLPFQVKEGTLVSIESNSNQIVEIMVDDVVVLSDQAVDFACNYISFVVICRPSSNLFAGRFREFKVNRKYNIN